MYFTIDIDNDITTYDAMPPAQTGIAVFRTEEQFTKATADWPLSRLIDTWNSFAGVAGPFADLKPVKKFENRAKATKRIWQAIQKLPDAAPATPAAKPAPKTAAPKPAAKKAAPASTETKHAPREGTAKAKVISLIERKGGATLQEIMAATNWQPHTVRGFISTLPKKTGLEITSTRRESDKARVYEVAR
jgi:hypothetical protein